MDSFELGRLTAYGISTTIVTSASNMLMKLYGITDGDDSIVGGDGYSTISEGGKGAGNPKKKQSRRKKRG